MSQFLKMTQLRSVTWRWMGPPQTGDLVQDVVSVYLTANSFVGSWLSVWPSRKCITRVGQLLNKRPEKARRLHESQFAAVTFKEHRSVFDVEEFPIEHEGASCVEVPLVVHIARLV